MKHGRGFLIGALMRVALAAALILIAAGAQGALAQTTIIYVDIDAQGASNGRSWHSAYTDLQHALTAAVDGDRIWVAEGTYKPTAQTDRTASFRMRNGVAVYGGFDPSVGDTTWDDRDWVDNVTILSGDIGVEGDASDNSYHVFYHPDGTDLDSSAILDGFTITSGNADYWGGDLAHAKGGGMYNWNSSPSLANCTFSGNWAYQGAGMFNLNSSSPTLSSCAFIQNEAGQLGGGIYNESGSSPALSDCAFKQNKAEGGGGMYNVGESSPTLRDECSFTLNEAVYGAGMFNRFGSSPYLDGCTFLDNRAWVRGGGMHNDESSPTLTDCRFEENGAESGGGVNNYNGSSPVLTNSIFRGNWANYGGAMSNDSDSSPTVTNCTFWSNVGDIVGGGMYNTNESSPTLTNCILWGNGEVEIHNLGSAPTVTYSDIQGGYLGTGNINVDPLFSEPAIGDFHLKSGSPCIDAGFNSAPSLPDYDFEGDFRRLDGDGDLAPVVDMGVDEYVPLHPIPQIVLIDITPRVPSNVIKLSSPRLVPVGILTTEEFDPVNEVPYASVVFAGAAAVEFEVVDINGDDDNDLVLFFYPADMDELTLNSKEATLTGVTHDGTEFEGTDKVKVRE